ncbi:NAD-P-binding protein [Irpex rosettiformis]|uniref:NAD-P-binding protein n=1 Tax=Irpex rosettiformis TaxID=378272 RepID=A0ACB8U4J7_9APHY|nr:NAD-P-binding protein [Irpex rosettiformis]
MPSVALVQPPAQRVWFITGTSSGFGKALIASVIARGDRVIATARSVEKIKVFYSLAGARPANLQLLRLDISESPEKIQRVIDHALSIWGRIDVVVNNAGIGLKSVLEEGGSLAAMQQFQTNVFGVLNVTNAVLPHMRDRRSGTVVIVGSRTGWHAAVPPVGFYAASKAAVHAIGESYASELAQFNIRVTVVIPGSFRTNALGQPITMNKHIPDYDDLRERGQAKFSALSGSEKGDPAKAMELLVDVVRGEGHAYGREWPMWLFMGSDVYRDVRAKCERVERSLAEWEDVATDLEF